MKYYCIIVSIVFLLATAQSGYACSREPDAVSVSLLNVGQGQSLLVRCAGDSATLLFDAGDSEENYPGADRLRLDALAKLVQPKAAITYAVATHAHPDHAAGFKQLLEHYHIERFYLHGADFKRSDFKGTDFKGAEFGDVYQLLRAAFARRGSREDSLGQALPSCSGLRITRLPTPETTAFSCPDALNDCSAVFHLQYKHFRLLFLADASRAWEEAALKSPALRPYLEKIDVLILGHHASAVSSSLEFLSFVKPRHVAFSSGDPKVGRTDELGYPSLDAVERIAAVFPQAASDRRIEGCRMELGNCVWTSTRLPEAASATVVDGTISYHLNNSGLCIEREKKGR